MRNEEAEGEWTGGAYSGLGEEWAMCPFPLQVLGPLPHEDGNLMLHLQRLETTLSVCAEEPDHGQLFTHLGRMALEFNRLASKVHKNEQRTSILQVRHTGRVARDRQACFPPELFPPSRSWESTGTVGTSEDCVVGRLWAFCSG